MAELVFESSLTESEIENNFKDISFFDGLMSGLTEALAYGKSRDLCKEAESSRSECCRAKKIAQHEPEVFSALIGVSKRTVEAWESGKCVPSPTAKKLIYLLSVEPSLIRKL